MKCMCSIQSPFQCADCRRANDEYCKNKIKYEPITKCIESSLSDLKNMFSQKLDEINQRLEQKERYDEFIYNSKILNSDTKNTVPGIVPIVVSECPKGDSLLVTTGNRLDELEKKILEEINKKCPTDYSKKSLSHWFVPNSCEIHFDLVEGTKEEFMALVESVLKDKLSHLCQIYHYTKQDKTNVIMVVGCGRY